MRTDESFSFLAYGRRFLPVAAAFYDSTNNHILHSILMRSCVWLFGDSAPVIRAPAFVFGVVSIPVLYKAGCVVASRTAGLAAAALYAGAPYAHELAVNARGYTIVNFSALLAIIAVPGAVAGRSASIAALAVAIGMGCWAVPIMLFPASVAVLWAASKVIVGRGRGTTALATAIGCALLFVVFVYAPAAIVIGPRAEDVSAVVTGENFKSFTSRVDSTLSNVVIAAHQFAVPFGRYGVIALAVGVTFGCWSLLRRRRTQYLPIACVIGPAALHAASGFTPPPFWSLTFAFPAVLIGAATSLDAVFAGREREDSGVRRRVVAVAGVAGLLWATCGRLSGPTFFGTVGFPEAKIVAARLVDGDLAGERASVPEAPVYVRLIAAAPLRYYTRHFPEWRRRFQIIDHKTSAENVRPGALVVWSGYTDVWERKVATPPRRNPPLLERLEQLERTGSVTIYRVSPDETRADGSR